MFVSVLSTNFVHEVDNNLMGIFVKIDSSVDAFGSFLLSLI